MSQINQNVEEYVPKRPPRLSTTKYILRILTKIVLTIVGYYVLRCLFRKDNIRHLSKNIEKHIIRNKDLRRILDHPFVKLPLVRMAGNHSHKDDACLRTSANIHMSRIVVEAGFTPYTVSMSSHDSGHGCRYFYMVKDLNIPYKDDEISDNNVLLFTDVDYYCDMNLWLRHFKPIIMYTMVPTKAAHRNLDHSYYIQDNEIHHQVRGGASYCHKVWDYDCDTLAIIDDDGNLLTFHVSQHILDADPDRRIITILPSTCVPAGYHEHLKYQNGLKRREYTKDGVNVVFNHITDEMSLSKNGSSHSVEINGSLYSAICSRLQNKTTPPVIADIERLMSANGVKNSSIQAPLLYELVVQKEFHPTVVPTNVLPCCFEPIGKLATEDMKNPGREFSNPLVPEPSMFAARGTNSDEACIVGRVESVSNDKTPGRSIKQFATEFVELLVPKAGIGAPWSVADVREAQNKPQQRQRYLKTEASLSTISTNTLTSFQKSEPYTSSNDPRNITTCSPELTTMASCYVYAFKKDILKRQPWYGPGKTPDKQARRLRLVTKDGCLSSDISRLDGRMSRFLQSIYKRSMMRWLKHEYRNEYHHWHKQIYTQSATTSNGRRYKPGFSTRSGSPITTDTNTLGGNAFIDYCALRSLGHSPKEAWELLGLYVGDDGARNRIPGLEQAILQVATEVGLKYEIDVCHENQPIKFCGRIYPSIQTSLSSYQDLKRTIPKLHLSSNKNVTDEQAAVNKASGYVVTDKNTPIVGDWAKKVLSLSSLRPKGLTHEETFKIDNGSFDQTDVDVIFDDCCRELQLTSTEMKHLQEQISKVKALDEFPQLLDIHFPGKLDAVIGDVIAYQAPLKTEESLCQIRKPQTKSSSKPLTRTGGSKVPPRFVTTWRYKPRKQLDLHSRVRKSTNGTQLKSDHDWRNSSKSSTVTQCPTPTRTKQGKQAN
uniref:RNA replicase n=1 Tax=Hubei noda-like virus 6 TaxID=1922986 RepID=A0A1L3KGH2_9VIRU|nr:hypothetical protein [Hubei noda-like virus 6]